MNLLFDLPLLLGGLIAGLVSLALLAVQNRRGQRPFERVITGFLLIIAVGFLAGLFVAPPSAADVAAGLIPRFDGIDSVLLATAMLGATVMPHVVYLHSALTRDRFGEVPAGPARRRLLSATRTDVVFAMILAGSVNIAMLLLAASALRGQDGVDTIEGAHAAVTSALGPAVGVLFAVGLLASGLASTSVGCYAGSVIMEGLLHRRVNLLLRRVDHPDPGPDRAGHRCRSDHGAGHLPGGAVVRAAVRAGAAAAADLGSAVMGADVNRTGVTVIGWLITGAIVALNAVLIVGAVTHICRPGQGIIDADARDQGRKVHMRTLLFLVGGLFLFVLLLFTTQRSDRGGGRQDLPGLSRDLVPGRRRQLDLRRHPGRLPPCEELPIAVLIFGPPAVPRSFSGGRPVRSRQRDRPVCALA